MSFTISCETSAMHWKQMFQALYFEMVHCCIVDITLSGCCELQHGGHNLQCIAYCNQSPCYFTACFAWHFLYRNLNSGALFQYKDHISRCRDIPSKNKITMKTAQLCNGLLIIIFENSLNCTFPTLCMSICLCAEHMEIFFCRASWPWHLWILGEQEWLTP